MGDQARGRSYDLKEQYEEVTSPSRDMNNGYQPQHFLSTSIASWCLKLHSQTDELDPLKLKEVWHNISVLDILNDRLT